MSHKKILLGVCFAAMLSLCSASGFAANDNPCQQIEWSYNKSNVEITNKLAEMDQPHRRDAKASAESCIKNFTTFKIDNADVNQTEIQASAQKILDAEVYLTAQKQDVKDFNFALGLGILHITNRPDVIETSVDNGVLRTTNEEKYKLGFWLSSNTFLTTTRFCVPLIDYLFSINYCLADKNDKLRMGMFVATQLGGNNDILNSFAAGISFTADKSLVGYKPGTAPLVFQLGYGWTHIQNLADGYSDGMTLPAGTNQPVMKKTIGRGPILIVSTAF
ncbi:MAG: hypothetical protein M0P42_15100 [Gallionella sp.]|nr:hypothetical protein [Gallionella sp.]